ncbi:hypothetical protein GCM10011369_07470 [Neiella marina]|uniref:DUF481 domain-containing protein n=1 Tax=Neiella marina TaxID=508461 RepID=A0A8J2U2R8_9GAMM|nr:hypothetical protein [Neiella marina]GGA68339.1 hypothetical protein GCM10011369_07470 [Neiella marina]
MRSNPVAFAPNCRWALALLTTACITTPSISFASAIYLGYGQSEQTTQVNERVIHFKPAGKTALLSFDLTDNLSISGDVYIADETEQVTDRVDSFLDIDSWSVGIGYYVENWAFSASYNNWQDELKLKTGKENRITFERDTESPSYSLSGGYDWYLEDWQLGVGLGVHYNDWQMTQRRDKREEPDASSKEQGNTTFISASLSASYYLELNADYGVLTGASMQWSQVTDSESQIVSRNGRNISQVNNRRNGSLINSQSALGSESYGQLNTYVSFDLFSAWIVDLNASFDFGGDETSTAWTANLGYLF